MKYFFACSLIALLISGCNAMRPTRVLPADDQSQPFRAPTLQPTATSSTLPEVQTTPQDVQVANCTNDLTYLEDLTIPDGMQVDPGTVLDKQWKVKNSGTCNWNETYSVRLVSGSEIGATSPQALIPARNGSDAVVSINLTAPAEPGTYTGTWRAYGPDEQPFGEWFSVKIVVTSP